MDSLYIVVIFENSRVIRSVPWKWVDGLNMLRIFNGGGVKKYLKRKVFFCANLAAVANFELPIRDDFDELVNACYVGRILKAFGKYFCAIVSNSSICSNTFNLTNK